MVFLSIKEDAFVTVIYMRHGSHQYNGMTRRDWKIFFTSLAIANIYWTVAAYMGISLVEWVWRAVKTGAWWSLTRRLVIIKLDDTSESYYPDLNLAVDRLSIPFQRTQAWQWLPRFEARNY